MSSSMSHTRYRRWLVAPILMIVSLLPTGVQPASAAPIVEASAAAISDDGSYAPLAAAHDNCRGFVDIFVKSTDGYIYNEYEVKCDKKQDFIRVRAMIFKPNGALVSADRFRECDNQSSCFSIVRVKDTAGSGVWTATVDFSILQTAAVAYDGYVVHCGNESSGHEMLCRGKIQNF